MSKEYKNRWTKTLVNSPVSPEGLQMTVNPKKQERIRERLDAATNEEHELREYVKEMADGIKKFEAEISRVTKRLESLERVKADLKSGLKE